MDKDASMFAGVESERSFEQPQDEEWSQRSDRQIHELSSRKSRCGDGPLTKGSRCDVSAWILHDCF